MTLPLILVVAIAENGVIGRDNQLLWRLRTDLKRFRDLTLGKPMIMGRKTFQSIGKPLPGRTSIIVTRDAHYQSEKCLIVHSVEEAITAASELNPEEIFVIGGAQIYACALPTVQKIYLTEVYYSFDGDTFFPELAENQWKEAKRESFLADQRNPYPYDFVELERK